MLTIQNFQAREQVELYLVVVIQSVDPKKSLLRSPVV
jgi:hypothetical protein